MKKTVFKCMMNMSCYLLVLSFISYLGANSQVIEQSGPLPMMPSKAKQKRIEIMREKQRKALRANMDAVLSQFHDLQKSINEQVRSFKYFNKQLYAVLLKKSRIMHKQACALLSKEELIEKKVRNEKKLIKAVQHDAWEEQSRFASKIKILSECELLAHQALLKHKKQYDSILKKENTMQKKLVDFQKNIAQGEQQLRCLFAQAQKCAEQLVQGPFARTEELVQVTPPVSPLSEI